MQNNRLIETIHQLKKDKKAVILAHYYQYGEIQEIADFVGDSLDLSRVSSDTDADIIVFAGVYFMAETAKILSPTKKVLIPDPEAGCSLADSCSYKDFKKFKENYPDHVVVTYVNTTAEIKTLSDITCTSTNAKQMRKRSPGKQFFPAPPIDSTCGCNDCKFMKLHTLQKIHDSLLYEQHEVNLSAEVIEMARLPIQRMLELSN